MGPPIPEGPMGRSGEGNQPIVGWCAPLGPHLRLGLETLGWGRLHLPWGALHPPWPPPPLGRSHLQGRRPPRGLYKGGREGSRTSSLGASLSPATPLPLAEARRSSTGTLLHPPPRRRAAGSSSTSLPPLLDQEGGDVTLTVRVLNAEVSSVRR